jgi:hypothetical protein
MPVTVSNFSAIDDTETDVDSPVTESLVARLRDNAYWVLEGTTKTVSASAGEYLEADGSGGVRWSTPTTIDGTKGTISHGGDLSTTYITITANTTGILKFDYAVNVSNGYRVSGSITVDLSDDSFVANGTYYDPASFGVGSSVFSGTITTANQVGYTLSSVGVVSQLTFRRASGNLQYASTAASQFFYASWVVI